MGNFGVVFVLLVHLIQGCCWWLSYPLPPHLDCTVRGTVFRVWKFPWCGGRKPNQNDYKIFWKNIPLIRKFWIWDWNGGFTTVLCWLMSDILVQFLCILFSFILLFHHVGFRFFLQLLLITWKTHNAQTLLRADILGHKHQNILKHHTLILIGPYMSFERGEILHLFPISHP